MEVAPVTAVSTDEPPQLFSVAGDELLMVTSGGRLSTRAKFVRFVSAGADILILNLEFSPGAMVAGENDLFAETPAPNGYTRTCPKADNPFVMP